MYTDQSGLRYAEDTYPPFQFGLPYLHQPLFQVSALFWSEHIEKC